MSTEHKAVIEHKSHSRVKRDLNPALIMFNNDSADFKGNISARLNFSFHAAVGCFKVQNKYERTQV